MKIKIMLFMALCILIVGLNAKDRDPEVLTISEASALSPEEQVALFETGFTIVPEAGAEVQASSGTTSVEATPEEVASVIEEFGLLLGDGDMDLT